METKLFIAAIVLFIISRFLKGKRKKFSGLWGKIYNEIFEWLQTGWSVVLLATILMYFFLQAFKIPTGSMRQTFLEGDHLFVNKFIYGFRMPLTDGKRIFPLKDVKKGDIVVFSAPSMALSPIERKKKIKKDFIKRCVALGGDWVELKNKKLYVNGEMQIEPNVIHADDIVYSSPPQLSKYTPEEYQRAWENGRFADSLASVRDNFGPVMVPPGHYFVLGDNRDRSFDSRFWGPLPDRFLKGISWFIYWPIGRMRIIMR